MKKILLIFLLSFSLCNLYLENLYLPRNGTITFNNDQSEGKFHVHLDEFKDKADDPYIEFKFEVYGGSISENVLYISSNDLNADPKNNAIKYNEGNRNEDNINIKVLEFSSPIELTKKYLILKFQNFNGNKLTIQVTSGEKAKEYRKMVETVWIIILICCCICCITGCSVGCYCCCCKKKNKDNYPGEIYSQQEEEYIPPPNTLNN